VPSFRSLLLATLIAAILVSVGVVAAQRRPEPTYPTGPSAAEYRDAVAAAIAAGDDDLVTALLPGAHTLLERAERAGNANADDVTSLRLGVIAANDYLNGVQRLLEPAKVGTIPDELREHHPRLVIAAGVIYLLAGDVYAFDASSHQLIALPDLFAEQAAGGLRNGSGDVSTLAAASEQAVYFLGDGVGGSALVYPSWPSGFAFDTALSSVFRSRLYLLDQETAAIVVVDPSTSQTTEWLSPQSEVLPASPIGMAIDGQIHVLYRNGQIYELQEGFVTNKYTPVLEPAIFEPQALALGSITDDLYIADLGAPEGRLIAWDHEGEASATYLVGPDGQGRLDAPVHESFGAMSQLLVDEDAGKVYWIAEDAIWQATLSLDAPAEDGEADDANDAPST
jgi:hypothetical protein